MSDMSQPSDHRVVVNAGNGAVVRNRSLIAVVGTADHPLVSLAAEGLTGDAGARVHAIVDRDAQTPPFAIARIVDDAVQLFVRGTASVTVGGLTLRHDGANPFVAQTVRVPENGRIAVRLDDSGPPMMWTSLGLGVVSGGGAELSVAVGAAISGDDIPEDSTAELRPDPPSVAPPPPGLAEPHEPARVISFGNQGSPAGVGSGADAAPPEMPVEEIHRPAPAGVGPVQVRGLRCQRDHLVHPSARLCPLCGDNMQNNSVIVNPDGSVGVLGPRPPLGVLILPDGRSFQLNRTTVIGRQPDLDAAVRAGEADGLMFDEPTVSRAHARVVLDDWDVSLVDLGSANGTSVAASGHAPQRLQSNQPIALVGGTYIYFGSIQIVFQPTSAAPHSR